MLGRGAFRRIQKNKKKTPVEIYHKGKEVEVKDESFQV